MEIAMNNCDAEVDHKGMKFSSMRLAKAEQERKNANQPNCILIQNVPTVSVAFQQTFNPQNLQAAVPAEISEDQAKLFDSDTDSDSASEYFSSLSPKSDSSANESPTSLTTPSLHNEDEQHYELLEYQNDILASLREDEYKHRPRAHFMERQHYLTPDMRAGVIDWLVDLTDSYDLETETLYLATSFIDRVLSCFKVKRKEFRLLATGALLIAVKYEEGAIGNVSEFAAMSGYTLRDILRTERVVLQTLAFQLCTATAYAFLNLYATKLHFPDLLKFLATFLCELVLLAYTTILPSVAAATAVALARFNLKLPIWTKELQQVLNYSLSDLKPSLLWLSKLHCASRTLPERNIQLKYKDAQYMHVSTIQPVELDERRLNDFIAALGN